MSDNDSPLSTLFELQRNTIKQTEDLLETALSVPRDVGDSLYSGVETQQELQERALELTRESVHTSLDAAESVSGDSATLEDLRESVDETFDTLKDQQQEAFDAVDEEYDAVGESYDELSEDALENLGEQIDVLVEFNEGIEDRLIDSLEDVTEQFEKLQEDLEESTDEAQERVEEQAEELADRFEKQLQQLSEQFEEQADRFGQLEDRMDDLGFRSHGESEDDK
ncbi:hypothetical protein [Natronomonas sp.]|uniref:hypothetical protein n=1 Tax=Natronomonas sp. TaxID=2184060 RepID=UPI002FC2D451